MALVTVQRSPSPSGSAETEEQDVVDADDSNLKSPRQRRRRSKSALKKLKKLFNTVRFVSKLKPCFSENYFTVKGAALILPQSDYEGTHHSKRSKSQGDIQNHLQSMFSLLRPQDTIKVAVRLEGSHTRYLAVVSCIGKQDTEESVLIGVNLRDKPEVGLILPIWAHTKIELDGDGGFSIKLDSHVHGFKPVSVQAMWSALQSLNKVVKTATDNLYIPRGLTHTWMGFYEAKLSKDKAIISEWNVLSDVDSSHRIKSKIDKSSKEDADFYIHLQTELKLAMMTVDLEEVTSRILREMLEKKLDMDLRKYRGILDMQMFEIMGQMDSPTLILDYLYLGSEWNASNLEELKRNGVHHILNISREIDNFFTGILHYMNIREWDVEQTDLMQYWKFTHKFINDARKCGSKTLVHCKMGISRSASTVIAYLMKENRWSLQEAYNFTKAKRSIINPNVGFWKQLETYEGILKASCYRDTFENKDGISNRPKNLEEVLEDSEFSTAEDMLALSIGKKIPESSDLPFLHTEQDIEIGSRSADSTEESFPDKLSPETIGVVAGASRKKKFPRMDSNVAESGDYIESDSSNDTDSDRLTSGEEDEVDRIFQPIDIPSNDGEKTGSIVKPNGRRVKSESDKTLLAVEEGNVQGFSREGSVSKFKPDESWINSEQEEEDEKNKLDAKRLDMEKNNQESLFDTETNDIDKIAAKIVEPDTTTGSLSNDFVTIPMENAAVSSKNLETSKDSQQEDGEMIEDIKGLEPYVKENIPWNLGTVLKQKQDLEEKFGSFVPRKNDFSSEKDGCINTEDIEQAELNDSADESNNSVKNTDSDLPDESLNLLDQAESAADIEDVDKTADSSRLSPEVLKSRRSVYDLEEIDLPEGIVKRTKMEIEERNRSLETENPNSKLQRSSSLKSTRVTPKAKNRDNERRKTCIAILSPTYNTSDSFHSIPGDDQQALNDTDQDVSVASDLDHSEASSSVQASGETEDDMKSQTGTVKIYKFLGEELTVQEGMVRKQTLDIEHKAKETGIQQSVLKADKEPSEPLSSSNIDSSEQTTASRETSMSTESNEPGLSDNTTSMTSKPALAAAEETHFDANSQRVIDSPIAPVENIKQSLYDSCKKMADATSDNKSSKSSVLCSPTGHKSISKSQPESCFDSETLKLIREIGSALMNSPAKCDVDESGGDMQKGGNSLVSHYVKMIERKTNAAQKKVKREIVIIEKEGEVDKQYSSDTRCVEQNASKPPSCDSNEIRLDSTKFSPVARRNTFPLSVEVTKKEISGPTGSIMVDPAVNEKTLVQCYTDIGSHAHGESGVESVLATDILVDNNMKMEPQDKKEREACSVKSLVDIFLAKSSSSTTCTPLTLSDSLITQQSAETSKSDVRLTESSGKMAWNDRSPPRCDKSVIRGITKACETTPPKHDPPWPIQENKKAFSAASPPKQGTFMTTKGGKATINTVSPTRHDQSFVGQSSNIIRVDQDGSASKQRHSEPAICLSDRSLHLFSKTLRGMGHGDSDVLSDVPEADTVELRATNGVRSDRPSSLGHTRDSPSAMGLYRQSEPRHSHTLSESDSKVFPWDGKLKTKKTYGKSHPLARLESQNSVESLRSSPFYSTM